MKLKPINIAIGLLFLISLVVSSCGPHGILTKLALRKIKPEHSYCELDTSYAPDYSLNTSWLVSNNENKDVDIFFVHPTSYKKHEQWNMAIDDTLTIARTYQRSIRRILSIFNDLGNVYAPKYRQAAFYAFVDTKGDGKKAIDLARKDVLRSFDYYIKYINQGRPFILAAHSQGSLLSMDILPLIYNDSNIRKQLIAAYVVGWPIGLDYLEQYPRIEVCKDSLQTGCIISWNTQTRHSSATIIDRQSLCTNPLNWTTDEIHVSNKNNLGAVFYLDKRADTIPNYIGAQCKKGVLRVDRIPDKDYLKGQYSFGILHRFDYNFFYLNVKHNAQQRIEAYLKEE